MVSPGSGHFSLSSSLLSPVTEARVDHRGLFDAPSFHFIHLDGTKWHIQRAVEEHNSNTYRLVGDLTLSEDQDAALLDDSQEKTADALLTNDTIGIGTLRFSHDLRNLSDVAKEVRGQAIP